LKLTQRTLFGKNLFFDHLGDASFYGKAFLHCDMNPILLVEQLLFSGCKIEWCACAVGYQQGPVKLEAELHICIYWVDKCPIPVFHFSSAAMTRAIDTFCDDFIGDTTRLLRVEQEIVTERISVQDFSRLLDHPVFMYYLSGTTAQKEVANARR